MRGALARHAGAAALAIFGGTRSTLHSGTALLGRFFSLGAAGRWFRVVAFAAGDLRGVCILAMATGHGVMMV